MTLETRVCALRDGSIAVSLCERSIRRHTSTTDMTDALPSSIQRSKHSAPQPSLAQPSPANQQNAASSRFPELLLYLVSTRRRQRDMCRVRRQLIQFSTLTGRRVFTYLPSTSAGSSPLGS